MRMAGPEAEKQEVSQLSDNLTIFSKENGTNVLSYEEITQLFDEHMNKNEIEIFSRKNEEEAIARENVIKTIKKDDKDTHMHHFDNVDRPMHYAAGTIECIDAIEAQLSAEEFRGYLKGNIIKYLWREKHKGGTESLKKAKWYLNKLLG